MNIASTSELCDRDVITCIQVENKNNARSYFQANQKEGLEEYGIKITGSKK